MNYSVEYYKEKDTDPMVFLQRFRCTTEPIGGGTEHDEEGELVSWDAAVAAIEIAMKRLGWQPASEKPIIPKDKEDIWVYCLVYGEDKDEKVLAPMFLRYTKLLTLGWVLPDDMIVVWWCYPPEKK